jgi:hypothetical protein
MFNISVERTYGSVVNISPMSIKRDWMDVTPEKHAYRCFPVTQANMIGWNLYCEKDLVFTWNGINDTSSENVKVLEGHEFSYTARGQSTVSINTGLIFRTDQDVSMLTINPVNYFNDDFETMSSLISTSFYDNEYPLAIKARTKDKTITIKAGQPIATIMPISLTQLDGTSINMVRYSDPERIRETANKAYGNAAQQVTMGGEWTDWYRNAINEKGESIGTHETKTLRLYVKNNIDNSEFNEGGII